MTDVYGSEIEQDATKYGYKAANLINLRQLVDEFKKSSQQSRIQQGHKNASDKELRGTNEDIVIQVPEFLPLEGSIIEKHLDDYAQSWRKDYNKFAKKFDKQENKGNLGEEVKAALEKLGQTIRSCFELHPLSNELFAEFIQKSGLKENDLVMVRSTGINEDKANMANPGGNESLPCHVNAKEISKQLKGCR